MFRWVKTIMHNWSHPQAMSDEVFERTIVQIKACRQQLTILLEEARLARQLVDITEMELHAARRQAKRELSDEAERTRQGIKDLLTNDATQALQNALDANKEELELHASLRHELKDLATVMADVPASLRENKARSDTPAMKSEVFTSDRRQR